MVAKTKSNAKGRKSKMSAKAKTNKNDIVTLLAADHKPLWRLLKTLKNTDADLLKRKVAFEEFSQLLTIHAKAEEASLYTFMKLNEDLKIEALEGDVEHELADQLVKEAKNSSNDSIWSARVKVLAELVEHHLEEEEEEKFPALKKDTELEERVKLGERYLQVKTSLKPADDEKSPERGSRREKSRTERPYQTVTLA